MFDHEKTKREIDSWFKKIVQYLYKQRAFEDPEAADLLEEGTILSSRFISNKLSIGETVELPVEINIAQPQEHGGEFDIIEIMGERILVRKKDRNR